MTGPALASFGICRAKPGSEEELGRRMAGLVKPTKAEPGCIRYSLFRAKDDPAVWLFFEEWRSEADFQAHVESPHLQAFLESSLSLMSEGPTSFPSEPIGVGS